MSHPHVTPAPPKKRPMDPFRRAVLRGFGILLPPLLTIVIFLWVGATVNKYILAPLENGTRWVLLEYGSDIRTAGSFPETAFPFTADESDDPAKRDNSTASGLEKNYKRTADGKYVPEEVYDHVERLRDGKVMPASAVEVYSVYHDDMTLRPEYVLPFFGALFILVVYLLGKFLAAGIGRFFWLQFETLIHRLPVVRNVYSSVKQVTDFLFTDPDLEFTRVVAVEYPRKGIWTVAFVTGESMLDIESAANEPVMSVLIPTSPMPFTGFTITVKKSETVDLNLSIDQAFQFVISCGVVVPPQQLTTAVSQRANPGDAPPIASPPAGPSPGAGTLESPPASDD